MRCRDRLETARCLCTGESAESYRYGRCDVPQTWKLSENDRAVMSIAITGAYAYNNKKGKAKARRGVKPTGAVARRAESRPLFEDSSSINLFLPLRVPQPPSAGQGLDRA